jgi:hypothetical protein
MYLVAMRKRTIEKTAGMYFLKRVNETESGFKLELDGSFKFFFSYGALDRYGSGTWLLQDDKVFLQSRPHERDFALVGSKTIDQNAIILKIVGGNPVLLNHVFFSLKNGETGSWQQTNSNGEVIFQLGPLNTISIVFEFCPEKYSHFTVENPTHNYFEFRFEAWLMEVFFDNFSLKAENYGLTGKHPLLKGEPYVYEKT